MKIKKSVAIFLALSMAFSLSMTTIAAGAEILFRQKYR